MPRVKLLLEYEGTRYVGWQLQANGISIQACVQQALERLVGRRVCVQAASRTDAGVHARGQVVAFDAPTQLPLKAYCKGLNGYLPEDIVVLKAEAVDAAFDARRWARGKRYVYNISNRPTRCPLKRHTHWAVRAPLDVAAMQAAAACLVGRQDFSAFRAARCNAKNTIRSVTVLNVTGTSGGDISITVEGTAFLRHMVRNMVGSLVEVGRGRRPPSWVAKVLASRRRMDAGATAPAHGLCLEAVFF